MTHGNRNPQPRSLQGSFASEATVVVRREENLLGIPFYTIDVKFGAVELPEEAGGRTVPEVLNDLADILEEGGWVAQPERLREAADDLTE